MLKSVGTDFTYLRSPDTYHSRQEEIVSSCQQVAHQHQEGGPNISVVEEREEKQDREDGEVNG